MSERKATVFALVLSAVGFLLGAEVDRHYLRAPRTYACVVQTAGGTLYVPDCEYLPTTRTTV